MTKYLLGLLFSIGLLSSCDNRKNYKYLEIVEEEGVMGGIETKEKESKSIKSESDSAAYLEAYKNFCISLKVNKDMKESLGKTYSTPTKFKLLNDKDEDITNSIIFANKSVQEKEIEKQIFALKNNLKESVDKSRKDDIAEQKKVAKIDLVKSKALKPFFRTKKDEFSNDNRIWYEPKSAPQYTNRNGIYCYFQADNGMPSNLRLRLQYYSDDWLFFTKVQFSIDGKAYDYIPTKTETDSGDGGYIWEWFDESLSESDKEMIYALANAKTAKMKLVGTQYHDIKSITKEQRNSIKRTLELYNAMGGKY